MSYGDDNDDDDDDIIIIIATIIIAMATRAVSFPRVFLSDKSYYLVRSTGFMMLMANNDKTFPVVYFVHFQDWFTNFGFLHPELFHVLSCRQDLPILDSWQDLPYLRSRQDSRQDLPSLDSRQELPYLHSRVDLPNLRSRQDLP